MKNDYQNIYMRWHRRNERNKTITTFLIGAIYGACAGFIGGVVFFNLAIGGGYGTTF